MNLKKGDILQRGLFFYRIYDVGMPGSKKDIVMNRILYNPKTARLQIYHGYEYAIWDEIGTLYTVLDAENPETKTKLEIIKRKYKLQKLNEIMNE